MSKVLCDIFWYIQTWKKLIFLFILKCPQFFQELSASIACMLATFSMFGYILGISHSIPQAYLIPDSDIEMSTFSQKKFFLISFLVTYQYSLWTLKSSQLMQVPACLTIQFRLDQSLD